MVNWGTYLQTQTLTNLARQPLYRPPATTSLCAVWNVPCTAPLSLPPILPGHVHKLCTLVPQVRHIKKKNQKPTCFLLQWSVTATERFCVSSNLHAPFLHQEVHSLQTAASSSKARCSTYSSLHFIHGLFTWLPHFKIVKLLDPSTSFLPTPLFFPPLLPDWPAHLQPPPHTSLGFTLLLSDNK